MAQQSKKMIKDRLMYGGLFILLFSTLFTPLSLLTFWLLPLPFFMLSVKQHWKVASICGLILTILVWWVIPIGFLFVLFATMIGCVMGSVYRRRGTSGTEVLLSGIIAAFVSSWILLLLGESLFQLIGQARGLWDQAVEEQSQNLPSIAALPEEVVFPIETILPFFLFLLIVFVPLCTFYAGRLLLKKQGYLKKYLPLFRHWRLPRLFFFFYAFLVLYMMFTENNQTVTVLQGIQLVLQVIFMIQGLSFFSFLLHHYQQNKWWILPIALSIFIPFLSTFLLFAGIIDCSFRVREWVLAKKE